MRLRSLALAAMFTSYMAAPAAWAQTVLAGAASPGGVLTVDVQLDAMGKLAYDIKRKGREIIAPSRLGFNLADAPKLDGGFTLKGKRVSDHDDTWEQPWGERRYVRNHYRELRVDVEQKSRANRRLAIVFRIYDDGVGFRYEFPDQPQLRDVAITDELTEFIVAQPATAWWIPAGELSGLEQIVDKAPLKEIGTANTPLTLRLDDGTHIALHEAALVDYATMWVRKVDGQKLRAQLAPSTTGPAVVGPRAGGPQAAPGPRARRARPVHVGPRTEPERAEPARRCVVGAPVEIRRRVVGDAPE